MSQSSRLQCPLTTTASIVVAFDPALPLAMAILHIALALIRSFLFSFSVAVVRIFSLLAVSPTRP